MQYQYADFEFAMCALRILVIVGLVAIISYAAKSRAMFVAGALGSLLGCVAPHGGIHINGTAEAVYMGQLHFTVSNIFWWGIIGATFGCLAVAGIQPVIEWGRTVGEPKDRNQWQRPHSAKEWRQ